MDEASMSYPRSRSGRRAGITSHENAAGAQEYHKHEFVAPAHHGQTPADTALAHRHLLLGARLDVPGAISVQPLRATGGCDARQHHESGKLS